MTTASVVMRNLPRAINGVLVALALWAGAASSAFAQTETSFDDNDLVFFVFFSLIALIYSVPSIVAFVRGHPNRWAILVINIVFGGTGLGWFGSLIWAFSAVHKSPTGSDGSESGLNIFANDPVLVRIDRSDDAFDGVAEQLRRLKLLREEGSISQEEYDRLRQPLLDTLAR